MENQRKNEQTKREQFEALVQFMAEHSDLATGNLKGLAGKERSNALWSRLTQMLNAEGPPIRSVDKWKKVWCDFKTHLKKKLRNNKHSVMGTGGGPSRFCPLSPLEEEVVRLLAYDATTEGVPAMSFGIARQALNDVLFSSNLPAERSISSSDAIVDPVNENKQPVEIPRNPTTSTVRTKKDYASLLEKQVENQTCYHETSIKVLKEIQQELATSNQQNKKLLKLEVMKYRLEKKKLDLMTKRIFIRQKKNN